MKNGMERRPYTSENSTNSQWAAMPAQKPPRVWQRMDLPTSSLQWSMSIMDTWVERYPLQHMHMPVNTAMSLAPQPPP